MNSKLLKLLLSLALPFFIFHSVHASDSEKIFNEIKAQKVDLELFFIIDKSGSMEGFETDTIGGFNSVLNENKKNSDNVRISTIFFDDKIKQIHQREPIAKVPNLTTKTYSAGGYTALLDAIGFSIKQAEKIKKSNKENDFLFVIITDGQENSSKEYTPHQIKSMIKKSEDDNKWDFIFLGANIDSISEAEKIGIKKSNATNYIQDSTGYEKAYQSINKAVSSKKSQKPLTEDWKSEVEADAIERKK